MSIKCQQTKANRGSNKARYATVCTASHNPEHDLASGSSLVGGIPGSSTRYQVLHHGTKAEGVARGSLFYHVDLESCDKNIPVYYKVTVLQVA